MNMDAMETNPGNYSGALVLLGCGCEADDS